MSRPPGGPPPEGQEPQDDGPYGPPPQGAWQPPQQEISGGAPPPYGYGPPQHGPPPYGPPGYGPPPYGPPGYGPPPPPYGPPAPRRRRGLVAGLVAGFVVVAVCVTVTAVLLRRDHHRHPTTLPGGITVTVAGDGSVTMAKGGARTVVDVYEDFQCPICKEFHDVNDATLENLAGEGRAKVVYHPMVIFAGEPMAGNSTRAASAARCVTDGGRWLAFQDQLFTHQPAEGSAGFGVTDLVSYGAAARVTAGDFASCVRTQRYAAQVRQVSRAAIAGGVVGTPTVKVNGKALPTNETLTAEGLRSAVDAAG